MKKQWLGFWTVASCLGALLLVGLPAARVLHDTYRDQTQLERLHLEMAEQTEQQCRLQWNLAKWYNYNLGLTEPAENFRIAYGTILSFGEEAMGILEIPQLGWQGVIFHGLQGPGIRHRPDSCFPTGGKEEQTVLELENSEILKELVPGMEILILCMDRTFRYRVAETPPEGGSVLLLVGKGTGGEKLTCRCISGPGTRSGENRAKEGEGAVLAAIGMGGLPLLVCWADSSISRLYRRKSGEIQGEKVARGGFFTFYGCKNGWHDV